jgi:hypothetical protein
MKKYSDAKALKKVIEELLKKHKCAEQFRRSTDFELEIVVEDIWTPLTIYKNGSSTVVIGHYISIDQDNFISDPEIVFSVKRDGSWVPTMLTTVLGNVHPVQSKEDLNTVIGYSNQWAKNLVTKKYTKGKAILKAS